MILPDQRPPFPCVKSDQVFLYGEKVLGYAKLIFYDLRLPSPKNDPTRAHSATFSRTISFILTRVEERFLSLMDRSKELIKPVNMVLKAKKTLSNARQEVEKHKIVRKMSWVIFKKMDLVVAGILRQWPQQAVAPPAYRGIFEK